MASELTSDCQLLAVSCKLLPVSENSRPSVAIRIVRPYETEEELLEHELETIGKTSVVLIGAHPRPTGVILRFEVTLTSGATVLRGEGRVLAHKENAFRGQSGLTLRFTRLDPKSKGVVDRATIMREARAQETGSPSRPAPRADSPIADALSASTPSPSRVLDQRIADQEAAVASALAAAREKANATARTNAKRTGPARGLTPPPTPTNQAASQHDGDDGHDRPTPAPTPVTSVPGMVEEKPSQSARTVPPASRESLGPSPRFAEAHPQAPTMAPPSTAPTLTAPPLSQSRRAARVKSLSAEAPSDRAPLEAPPDRAELLARLRERAAKLPRERVEEILSARPSR